MIYLDTHVVAWLYGLGRQALSEDAAKLLGTEADIRISPMVRLELQYLFEIQRVSEPPLPVIDHLQSAMGLSICRTGFPAIVQMAEAQDWTRDPFDRIIVAQAAVHEATLITKDTSIRAHYPQAIW